MRAEGAAQFQLGATPQEWNKDYEALKARINIAARLGAAPDCQSLTLWRRAFSACQYVFKSLGGLPEASQ
jgi:hypothetical protein